MPKKGEAIMNYKRFRYLIVFLFLLFPWSVLAQDDEILPDLNEQIVQVPLVLDGFFGKKEISLTATTFHPPGNGPFPLIVLSHGSRTNPAIRLKIGRFRPAAYRLSPSRIGIG
jgi:hypothetical protein